MRQKNLERLCEHNEDIEFEHRNDELGQEEYLIANVEGHTWNLQSQISMAHAIEVWCNQFEEVAYHTVFVVFGMGYVDYLLQLSQKYPKNLIIVYEPDERVILKQIDTEQMESLLDQDKVCWAVGKNRKSILGNILDGLDFRNGMDIQSAVIPNYVKMYPEECNFFFEEIATTRNYMLVSKNTKIVKEEVRGKCYLYNILDLSHQASVQNLIDKFKEADVHDFPAVLIAAGPSLDNNIKELLPYQEQVFIICLDSAVRTVLRWGIVPDLLVCVDPEKNPELFDNELGRKIPLISHLFCNYEVTKMCGGRKFYAGDSWSFERELLGKYHTDLKAMATGGTVAHTAFSLLREMGFQTIILIGQDLAYPGKRMHTIDAQAEKVIDEKNDSRYFYVDGVDGKPVLTEFNMNLYRRWYEEQIIKFPELNIIDATEGGALIRGTKIMTLKEALESNCTGRVKAFSTTIQSAEYLLAPDQQEEMRRTILEVISMIPDTMKALQAQQKVYDELEKLNTKRKYHTAAYKKCIAQITEFNRTMDESMPILLMQLFANKGDYEVHERLQKKCDSQYEEIKLMVEVGRQLVDTYMDAGKKLLAAWNDISGKLELN